MTFDFENSMLPWIHAFFWGVFFCALLMSVFHLARRLYFSAAIDDNSKCFTLNTNFEIASASPAMSALLRQRPKSIIGQGFLQSNHFYLEEAERQKLTQWFSNPNPSVMAFDLFLPSSNQKKGKITATISHDRNIWRMRRYRVQFSEASDLRKQDDLYHLALEEGPALLVVQNATFETLKITPALCRLLEIETRDVIGKDLVEWAAPKTRELIKQLRENSEQKNLGQHQIYDFVTKSGQTKHLTAERRLIDPFATGDQPKFIVAYKDVSELEEQRNLLDPLINHNAAIVFSQDQNGKIQSVSDAWQDKLGYTPEQTIGRDLQDFMTPEPSVASKNKKPKSRAKTIGPASYPIRTFIGKNGKRHVMELRTFYSEKNGKPANITMIVDITQSVETQKQLEELVNIDDLTTLLSRRGLKAKLDKRPRDCVYELILIDIDRFKSVNDTYGHDMGDALLRRIGQALKQAVPENGFACRLGGEEFAILRPTNQPFPSLAFAHQVRQTIARCTVPGPYGKLSRTASIGTTLLMRNEPLSKALTWADLALREAKDKGRDTVIVVNDRFRKKLEEDGKLISQHDLIQAVENQELSKFCQPIIDARAGHILGFEALIRWVRPDGTVVTPQKFLNLYQNLVSHPEFSQVPRSLNGDLIKNLTAEPEAFISFNTRLEALSFSGAAEQLLREFGMDIAEKNNRTIVLEISEASIHDRLDKECVLREMEILRKLGVKIALDDFGKAASNLYRLTNFPIDIVKIDRSLVERIVEDYRSRETLRAISHLAKALRFEVIAEGVETPAQRDLLLSLGIDIHQGFLYGRPCPVDRANDVAEWRSRRRSALPKAKHIKGLSTSQETQISRYEC